MVPIDPDIDFGKWRAEEGRAKKNWIPSISLGDSNNNNNNSNSSYSSNTTTTTTAAAAANSNSSSFYATSPNSSPAGPPTSTTTTSSSKPFLYSLLSSSPFSSLFSSSAQSLNSTSISPSSAAAAVAVATASSSPSRHSNQHYYSNPPSPPSERLDNVRNASLVNSPGLGSPASVAAATAPTTIISTTTRNSTSSGGYGFLGFNMMGFSLGENTDSSQAIISSATVNSSIPPLENNFQTSSGTANANATTNTIPANNNSNNIQNPSSSVSPSIFRTKSLMDLPSLWSASLGFGIVKPRASASGLRTSDSSDSLFENNNSNGDSSLLNTSNNLNQTFASNTSSTTNSSPNDRPLSRLTNSYSASSFSELESSENNGNSQQQQQQGPSSSSSAPPQPPPLQLSLKFINYSLVKRLVCGYESPVASILEIVDLFEDSQPIDTTSIDLTLLSASDFQFLINTLRTVFSSSESLTQSFSCPNSVSGIDLEDVGKSYKLICYLVRVGGKGGVDKKLGLS